MQIMLKQVFSLVAVIAVFCGAANAADSSGRGANSRANRTALFDAASPRMPTMPSLPVNSVGNISTNVPSGGNGGGVNPGPGTQTNCPDGGVKNSTYTVENCMNDIQMCINNGALSGGMNEMFDENVRNAIISGMGLCRTQVDKCIRDVRVDCNNVYNSAADVWIDFNSRRVQPEYYNFVLRKTGLTPNQAETTCLLLDRNVYGSSFNAVSTDGNVTAEYNKSVGAYNSQNGNILIKSMPQGATVNNDKDGVDANRGYYARWDAKTADCYVRVAAYNKDTHIKNSWLFGAAGDDEPAEVWRATGDTFSCNKDLFGFSLMNKTSTAAVVGIAGGTVLGAGVGALAAHGKRVFDCNNDNHREMLTEELRNDGSMGIISEYMTRKISATTKIMDVPQCEEVVTLYDKYNQIATALLDCRDGQIVTVNTKYTVSFNFSCTFANQDDLNACFAKEATVCASRNFTTMQQCENYLLTQVCSPTDTGSQCKTKLMNNGVSASSIRIDTTDETEVKEVCSFYSINLAHASGNSIYCPIGSGCQDIKDTRTDIERLGDVFTSDISSLIRNGEKSTIGKGVGIGAAVGAGTGGVATAITAFVERSNINCRVGDNLAQVGFGKSYSIGSLRDFYVKWNLRLPDTAAPVTTVTDCDGWRRACVGLTDLNQCKTAQVRYTDDDGKSSLVYSACSIKSNGCTINETVAITSGACEATGQ